LLQASPGKFHANPFGPELQVKRNVSLTLRAGINKEDDLLLKRIIVIFIFCFVIIVISIFTKFYIDKEKNIPEYDQIDFSSRFNSLSINGIMLTTDLKPAFWMGEKYKKKYIVEPINVIVIDSISISKEESITNLEQACIKAGYSKNTGHSSGYVGLINGITVNQIPKETRVAFSDNSYWKENNHGRFFGPYYTNNKQWIYIGQFSREKFVLFAMIHHKYISFNASRNDFTKKMNILTEYQIIDKIKLNNIFQNISVTSGDHDGNAVVLELKKNKTNN
jgi:hypothetical protein